MNDIQSKPAVVAAKGKRMKATELRNEMLSMLNQQLELMLDACGFKVPGSSSKAGVERVLTESDLRMLMRDRANAMAVEYADRCAEHADTTEELAQALEAAAKALRERDL